MAISLKQAVAVGSYVVRQRLAGRKRYPLVLMLEPLFRCNLACGGCGKIQHPVEVLRRHLTPGAVLRGGRGVRRAGRLDPRRRAAAAPADRRDRRGLGRAQEVRLPVHQRAFGSKRASTSSRRRRTSRSASISTARARCTITRSPATASSTSPSRRSKPPKRAASASRPTRRSSTAPIPTTFQDFFDFLTDELQGRRDDDLAGLPLREGARSGSFSAPQEQTRQLFREILAPYRAGKKKWEFNASPFFLDFLTGEKDYDCTPWGMPSYSLFGWQKPCYLLGEGYATIVQGAARRDGVGRVRSRQRQPEVRGLHGALGLRSDGGGRHDAPGNIVRVDPGGARASSVLVHAPAFEAFETLSRTRASNGSTRRRRSGRWSASTSRFDDPDAKRGKRLRPRILVDGRRDRRRAAPRTRFAAAAAVELLHNFSLVHDDIEDRDELRHGRPTLWVRHGDPRGARRRRRDVRAAAT